MEKEIYQAPQLEVDEIKVEKGFATSQDPGYSPWEDLL